MNPTSDTTEVVEERYERGVIRQAWIWICDDCVDQGLAEDDLDIVAYSSGDCDSLHDARLAMLDHNAAHHTPGPGV